MPVITKSIDYGGYQPLLNTSSLERSYMLFKAHHNRCAERRKNSLRFELQVEASHTGRFLSKLDHHKDHHSTTDTSGTPCVQEPEGSVVNMSNVKQEPIEQKPSCSRSPPPKPKRRRISITPLTPRPPSYSDEPSDDLSLSAEDCISGVISTPPIKPLEEGDNVLLAPVRPPSVKRQTPSPPQPKPQPVKQPDSLSRDLNDFTKVMEMVTKEQLAIERRASAQSPPSTPILPPPPPPYYPPQQSNGGGYYPIRRDRPQTLLKQSLNENPRLMSPSQTPTTPLEHYSGFSNTTYVPPQASSGYHGYKQWPTPLTQQRRPEVVNGHKRQFNYHPNVSYHHPL